MTLEELEKLVTFAVAHEKHPEGIRVVIDAEVPHLTAGARPSVDAEYACMGFDWEMNQFRITPKEKMMAIKYDVPQKVVEWKDYFHCPKCERIIGKRKKPDIKFCCECGQAVKWE